MNFMSRLLAPRVNFMLRDFKDRRDSRQRLSYAAIGGLQQRLLDRQMQSRFDARVRENVARREDLKRGMKPAPIEHRLSVEFFIPEYIRATEARPCTRL